MGYTGSFVVCKTDLPFAQIDATARMPEIEGEWSFGEWKYARWHRRTDLDCDEAHLLVRDLAAVTGAPVLAGWIFDSDCSWFHAWSPSEGLWETCLVRDVVEGLDELTPERLIEYYGTTETAVRRALNWAADAGLASDAEALRSVVACDSSIHIFPGQEAVRQLLHALGVFGAGPEVWIAQPDNRNSS